MIIDNVLKDKNVLQHILMSFYQLGNIVKFYISTFNRPYLKQY